LIPLLRVLLLLLLGSGLAAQGHGDPHAARRTTAQMEAQEFFIEQYVHLHPHAIWRPEPELATNEGANAFAAFYDVNLFQLFAIALCVLLFVPVRFSFGRDRVPWIVKVFRGWCLWIRDEMVYAVMGREDGQRFAPFFVFLFFFVAFMNLFGLVPGSVTATASVFVTGAMAIVTMVLMIGGGMLKQGPVRYWVNLLPHGLPFWLVPLMAAVELVGLVIRPFALMVRLFANMLAGHLVLYSFIGLIFLFAKMTGQGVLSWGTAVPAFGLAVFIYLLESFIVLLQAYIFVYLSIIFVHLARHPDH
jgi:F-type H+-transporting ATPase subunit a